MKPFHKNLDIMSIFTALLLALVVIFWRTFFNIAVTNIFLNGIIIGMTIFGIGLCFIKMFRLLPEYKWMHAYFAGRSRGGFSPRLLRPVAFALQNRHLHITTSVLSELLDLVATRIDEDRNYVRYITNTLIFLGLLGTFWGLILTIGGFAELLMNIDFENTHVLQEMQFGLSGPLSGMATAFTSSLLGLGGSLFVGFLGLQLQFAQNTMFQELADFMSQYVLQKPDDSRAVELSTVAPLNEKNYETISAIYESFIAAKYDVRDLIRIDGKYPAVVAIGTNEKLFIATMVDDKDILQNVIKRIDLCFADTLEGISINTNILCITNKSEDLGERVIKFASIDALDEYLMANRNVRPTTNQERTDFDAYAEYIGTAVDYLFK